LEVWFDRLNCRPYANPLLIRVGRGYLRAGDGLPVRFGDRRQGSPGYRLQTNVETNVQLKTSVDPFATYEFCELPVQPELDLVAGPPVRWEGEIPSLVGIRQPVPRAAGPEGVGGGPSPRAREAVTVVALKTLIGFAGS